MMNARWASHVLLLVMAVLVACGAEGPRGTRPDLADSADASVPLSTAGATPVSRASVVASRLSRQKQGGPAYRLVQDASGAITGRNVAHQLDVELASGAIGLTHAGSAAWHLAMKWTGLGRGVQVAPVQAPASLSRVTEIRASYARSDGSEEWYESGPVGVEQGFVLPSAPAGAREDAVAVEVSVGGDLAPSLGEGGARIALADAHGATVAYYSDLSAFDADGTELRSWLEVAGRTIRLRVDDANARYPLTIDPVVWTFQQELTAGDGAAGDWFGAAVSVSGTLAIIGAPNHTVGGHAGAGAAYVYLQSGATWTLQQELTAGDAAAGDAFGSSVSLSGGLAIIGAPSHAVGGKAGAGAAYVFVQSGTTWSQQQELTAGDDAAGDAFGTSVSVSGTDAIVGAPDHAVGGKAQEGAAYVFVQGGTTWSQQQELTAADGAAQDWFGSSVSVSASTSTSAIVGSPYHTVGTHSAAGAAYVFGQSGTTWSLQTELTASDGAANDGFGTSVAVSGTSAFAGAPFHTAGGHSQAGAAYAFTQSGTTWGAQQELTASDGKLADLFGFSLSVSGTNAVVGAYQHDVGATVSAGAAYFFFNSCLSWTQQLEVTAGDDGVSNFFGYSVGVSSTTAIVGAYNHDVGASVSAGASYTYNGVAGGATTCCIGGTSYASGTVNPGNACEVCTPATSTTTWSNEPNGTSCAVGEVCSSGTCVADCFIGGTLYPAGTVNPGNACQVCTPATSTTAWSNEPNGTNCAAGEVCSSGTCSSDCFIGGTLYPAGTVNAANACQVCTPATSTTAWSNEPNGTSCAAGEVCSSGTCSSDCFIGGTLYPAGTVNPANACQVCTPATSTTAWSNEPNGTSCAAGEVCSSGTCSSDCFIGGTLYPAGTVNPANACQVCTPATSTTAWSNEPNGTSCAAGEVCSSGTCSSDCFIGGTLYPAGTVNPTNACQVCTPATSTTAWSDKPNGTSCAVGEVCSSGACVADCDIGGTLYPAGTVNPANACQVCTPATSTTAWSNEPNGTSCAAGEVCSSGTCSSDCFIGGTLYPAGTVNPANACQVCTPATSTTAWSNKPNGTSCAAGEVCSSGACVADCDIGGTLYPAGTVNPANACEVCTPATSTTAWSNEPNGTSCAAGEVCSSGACVADCDIGGTLYPAGTVNPANACQICTPATSTTAWSNEPNGTSCAAGEVCSSGTCVADCDIGGTLYPAGTVNPANACQVCTPATSTTAWSNEPNGTSCAAGEVCSSGACVADCDIGGTLYPAGTVNPANACQVCTPASSTMAWSNEPDGTSCGAGEACSSGTCVAQSDGGTVDAGTVDAGSIDSGSLDSGAIDSGLPDSGLLDSGLPDSGPVDSGTLDGSTPEAGSPDGGPSEAGTGGDAATEGGSTIDAGADAGTTGDGGSTDSGSEQDASSPDAAMDGSNAADAETGDGGNDGVIEGGGCGCRTTGTSVNGELAGLPLLGIALLLARRRRRLDRRPSR